MLPTSSFCMSSSPLTHSSPFSQPSSSWNSSARQELYHSGTPRFPLHTMTVTSTANASTTTATGSASQPHEMDMFVTVLIPTPSRAVLFGDVHSASFMLRAMASKSGGESSDWLRAEPTLNPPASVVPLTRC